MATWIMHCLTTEFRTTLSGTIAAGAQVYGANVRGAAAGHEHGNAHGKNIRTPRGLQFTEADPNGWTKSGRLLDGAAG